MNNKLNLIYKPYDEVENLIEEGDILLFRGQGWISKLLKISAESVHSHVAIASWHNGSSEFPPILECVEFKEGKGGRAVNLKRQVEYNDCLIDVFRPIPFMTTLKYDSDNSVVNVVREEFNGKLVTNTMRQLSGLPYGYKRIWWIAKHKMVGFRLFYSKEDLVNDEIQDIIYPVCSTAIAHSFSKHGYDLIKNKSDEYTEPGHIALSPRLGYLFTLCINKEQEHEPKN